MTSQTNIPASPIRTLGEFFAFAAATAITAAMATFLETWLWTEEFLQHVLFLYALQEIFC